ncbi:MAG: DsbA family protein [Myxococcota bacterium]|nr:DsbA family protein [Myxococcota bacterium]
MGSKLRGVAIGAYLGAGPKLSRAWHATRHALRAERVVTFWHQVDDPWSHVLLQALADFPARFPNVRLEPVVVPEPAADVDPEPQKRAAYALVDATRLARAHHLSFPRLPLHPEPDRVRRAQAILLAPRDPVAWLDAATRVGDALFRGDGDALSALARELGTVPGQQVRPTLEAAYARLRKSGHYVGGVLGYDGEHYWGIDRLPFLVDRLVAEGAGEARDDDAPVVPRHAEANDELRADAPTAPVSGETFSSEALGSGVRVHPSVASLRVVDGRARIDAFVSFRSPYSYLALHRLEELVARFPLDVRLRFVMPMVARGIPVPKQKLRYIAKDAKREADRLGVPFGRILDPLGDGVARALALACTTRRELGDASALRLARVIGEGVWARAVDLTTAEGLLDVATRAGVETLLPIALDDATWRDEVEANAIALGELGLWGVPSFDLGDEALWGNDRLAHLEERLLATFAG